jgi:bifunctional non-homologous end joining protein LigD
MRPMLATHGTVLPTGPGWAHEVKWDGMRVLATVVGGRLTLTSRNENDVTAAFPELAGLADPSVAGGHDIVLDGEIVALTDGVPRFGALADRIHVRNVRRAEELARANPVTLMVFDLLALDGLDVTSLPWSDRRGALEALELDGPRWQVPPVYDDGALLQQVTEQQGLEGVVSKRRTSSYRPGLRTKDWLKFPHRPTGSYVVGGWRPETGGRDRLGALLVGEPTADGLVFRGRVGSGLAGKEGERVATLLRPLETEEAPFVDVVPREDAVGARWVRPELVVEVASLGFTPQQRLRQPSYLGVRKDLTEGDLAVTDG